MRTWRNNINKWYFIRYAYIKRNDKMIYKTKTLFSCWGAKYPEQSALNIFYNTVYVLLDTKIISESSINRVGYLGENGQGKTLWICFYNTKCSFCHMRCMLFYKQCFFLTQPQFCLTFLLSGFQMLLKYYLIYIDIIKLRHFLLVYSFLCLSFESIYVN